MYKRILLILTILFILCISISGCGTKQTENNQAGTTNPIKDDSLVQSSSENNSTTQNTNQNQKVVYKDGVYESDSNLTTEYYYGKAKVIIKDGKINDVDFKIYDKGHNDRLLDESYGKEIFAGQPQYQEQTTNELAGIEKYKSELTLKQELDKVDLISGATWSFRIYKETVENALKKAVK
jgi:uncharacterized protein with FMN-binding domain